MAHNSAQARNYLTTPNTVLVTDIYVSYHTDRWFDNHIIRLALGPI